MEINEIERNSRTKKMMLWFGMISMAMTFAGLTSAYVVSSAVAVAIVGLVMLFFAGNLMQKKDHQAAYRLMLSSVVYISLVQVIYVMDKFLVYGN